SQYFFCCHSSGHLPPPLKISALRKAGSNDNFKQTSHIEPRVLRLACSSRPLSAARDWSGGISSSATSLAGRQMGGKSYFRHSPESRLLSNPSMSSGLRAAPRDKF